MNRAGGRVAAPSTTSATELPPHEDSSFSLTDIARRELNKLVTERNTSTYKNHLGKSIDFLGTSVDSLFETYLIQKQNVENRKRKRVANRTEPTADDVRLEAHLLSLETQIEKLSTESEEAIREIVDYRYGLEDEGQILNDLYARSMTEPLAGGHHHNVEPDEEDQKVQQPPANVLKNYHLHQQEKEGEYADLTVLERYAKNNDYINFKRIWHDAAVGEEGPPLPDASRWFNNANKPVLTMPWGQGGNTGLDEDDQVSDDDIAIEREILSLKCPLSLKSMEEPFSSKICNHTFERQAIWEYLSDGGDKQCPQTGCSRVSLSLFLSDSAW